MSQAMLNSHLMLTPEAGTARMSLAILASWGKSLWCAFHQSRGSALVHPIILYCAISQCC